MPISTQSVTVMIVVPRSRPTFTPGRGACQPPMPICTRFFGRHVGDVGGVEPGRGVHALVEVGLLRVDVAVEVDDAELAAVQVLGHAAHGRVADGVVAAEHDREGAAVVDVRRRPCVIWSKVFSMFAGDREDVAEVGTS